ncbi:MAG: rhodanese-like domain-containing protein [Verrucomicrobiota bacterium]|nr:rhodanese-like domain-containing protein [Verrucomicrobiota bacterium]
MIGAGALLFIAGAAVWALASDGRGLDGMKKLVRARFPNVQQTSTGELSAWLKDGRKPQPVLLDVRTKAEFDVSHLPGARRVDPEAKAADVLPVLEKDRPVVTYCSVGYRSSAMADRLRKAGVTQVSNLEGSIFQWANEGRPLETNGKPATKVHPYNATFGKMLDEQRRAKVRD